jgi:aldehyde dehydrogenase (NAD+)
LTEFEGDKGPAVEGDDYTSIINKTHYARVSKLIDETKGEIVINGGRNEAKLKIGITVVTGVKEDDPLMEDEIFGPVLPILVKDKEATVAYLRKLPSPLATYYFGSDKQTRQFCKLPPVPAAAVAASLGLC